MADPRLFTVKQCQPAYSAMSGASIGSATSTRRDFFNALGKIGDLQVLNSVGGGQIGAGLRNLASISNAIRVGTGSLPTSIGSTLDAGADWVLNQTGIAGTVVDAVRGFNPGVANQALGQARNVFQMVKGGSFKTSTIPAVIQDFQNLERLGRNIFTPGRNDVQTQLTERCDASPYAVDLIARAPKYKFLFVVQFVPNAGYEDLSGYNFGPLDMAFTVMHTTRPNIRFQQEDVNYYNYRTKVVTKTEFEDMSMTFHDDTLNIATEFYRSYLRALSPITGMTPEESDPSLLEKSGMNFEGRTLNQQDVFGNIEASSYAASTGLLSTNAKNVFKEIRIYHLYEYGNKMNVYRFANPRISQLALDDLDMSVGNEGSQISITFNYDSLYLDVDIDVGTTQQYNIGQLQRGGLYPLRYNGDGPYNSGETTISPNGSTSGIGGFGTDPISPLQNGINSVIGQGQAAIASVSNLSTKFSNALGSLPFL